VSQTSQEPRTLLQTFLDGVETVGNKVPHPAVIFLVLWSCSHMSSIYWAPVAPISASTRRTTTLKTPLKWFPQVTLYWKETMKLKLCKLTVVGV
jgi:p-aminobenzoyl-glutamate transporter AbgT